MPDEDGFATDEETVEIYNLVNTGTAFKNNVAQSITDLEAVITDQVPKLTTLSALTDPNGILNWDQQDLIDLIAAINALSDPLVDFRAHTDRVSGTSFPGDITNQNGTFLALISVSDTLADIEAKINQGETDTITDFFGSLTDFPPIIAEWIDFLTDLDLKIQILAPYQPPEFPNQPLPVATIAEIDTWAPQMDGARSQENQAYDDAITTIINWAMASTLISPSGIWRDFVFDVTATPALQALLPEAEE